MPAPLSAIDAISPAFGWAKRQLFQPFRFGFWGRMALVAIATGEFYSSSGWGGMHFNLPASSRNPGYIFFVPVRPHWEYLKRYLPWILAAILLMAALLIFWIYVSSVFRFVLFDSVLTDRCKIKEEWRHWQSQGMRFFLWRICFGLCVGAALGILAGAVILTFLKTGAFANPRQHIVLLVLGGLGGFLALVCLVVVAALIALFAKDFLVPVMALENVGIIEGWRRVIVFLRSEKRAYVGYVLMKIVLVVGCAIFFGILTLIAVLLLFIPFSIVGFGTYFFAKSLGLLWKLPAIIAGVVLVSLALGVLLYAIAFISAPAMIFFQAYAIHFLGSRYSTLGGRISPPPLPLSPEAGISPAG